MKRNLRNLLVAALFAVAPPLLSAPAMAQGMPMMPMGHHLDRLAEKLKLTPEQKPQWDAMVKKTKEHFEAMRKAHHEMHEAFKAEMDKPEPDLAALAAKSDAMRERGMAAHKELRDGWLKLYATMSPEQKGVVKHAILHHMKMRHMREKMMGGHGDHGGMKHDDSTKSKDD